jgi:hypothetical protein
VLADRYASEWLIVCHDCFVVVGRGCNGVPDRAQRKADRRQMLAEHTPWEARRELLEKYDISSYLVGKHTKDAIGWTQGRVVDSVIAPGGRYKLLSLATN